MKFADSWRWPGGWQDPWRYGVAWHGGGWMLTWHAPWCRRCERPGSGWRFAWDRGYIAGLGFELSYPVDVGQDGERPLRTEADHAEALRQVDAILARSGDREPEGPDAERLGRLVALIDAFERWHPDHRIDS